MTDFRKLSDQETEAILDGTLPVDPDLRDIVELVTRFRSTGAETVDESAAIRHIAAAAEAVRLSPTPVHDREAKRYQWRRRTVFTSFISTIVAKVLAASVALAAVTGGVGAVANASAPGDPLYGVDTAMERIGVFDGGPAERLQEVQRLFARNEIANGLRHAGEALDGIDGPQVQSAVRELERAAERVNEQSPDGALQSRDMLEQQIREQLRLMTDLTEPEQLGEMTESAERIATMARRYAEEGVSETSNADCDGEGLAANNDCPGTGGQSGTDADEGPGSGSGHIGGDDSGSDGGSGGTGGSGGSGGTGGTGGK